MIAWIIALLLWIHIVGAAELIRIPLVEKRGTAEALEKRFADKFAKRGISYTPLLDHVFPAGVLIDVVYLGAIRIGTPPQTFLVGM